MKRVLSIEEAMNYQPRELVSDDLVEIPQVDVGEGYRQLEWREKIAPGDQYYGGCMNRREWVETESFGDAYRPYIANSIYAPFAIFRRKINGEAS